MNNKAKQTTKNVVVNVMAKMVMMLLPFAIRSVMIYTLGTLYLGLDSLFSSILNMLSLSELGFSAAIVYAMYKPVAENDDRKVRALLTFYRTVYRIVGCVIVAVGLVLLPNLKMFIAEGTAYPEDINIYVVYLILLVNTGSSYFLFAYKNSILVATMRNDLNAIMDMVRSLVSHGLQIVLLVVFRDYYLYVLVLPIITIANNLCRNHIINKRYPQYMSKEPLDKAARKDIMTRVGALIGNRIGGVVFTSVDSIVISSFLGLGILGCYTNYYTIYAAVYAVFSSAYIAIQSTIGNSLVCKTKEENYVLFRKLFSGNSILTCLSTCCFLFLYQPFMRIWVGEANLLGWEIPVLLALYYYTQSTRRICFLFKEAAGMWREDWLKPYVSVIINLTFNIVMVQIIGLPGVIISSIVALALVEVPWETTVFFKRFFQKKMTPYLWDILRSLLSTAVAAALVGVVSYGFDRICSNDFLLLAVRFLLCAVATMLVYLPVLKNVKINKLTAVIRRK